MYQYIWLTVSILILSSPVYCQDIYCRYQQNGENYYGQVDGETIHTLSKAPWEGGRRTGNKVRITEVQLLHPSEPQKIIGISGSFKDSWAGREPFKTIRWFSKTPASAASPDEEIELPQAVDTLLVETELVAIIGKKVKNASPQEAKEAIFGYTIGNDMVGDVTSYHQIAGEPLDQEEVLLSSGLKMGDKFSPYGPFIYTGVDWNNRERVLIVRNEESGKELVYKHNTNNFLYPPEKIVSDLSKVFSLNPGDVIFTGTTGALPAQAGDEMIVTVEGLGEIRNKLVAPKEYSEE